MTSPDIEDPAVLVKQWAPFFRRVAWETGCPVEDVQQEAWLLAAADVKRGPGFVGRWLTAVRTQASVQGARAYGTAGDSVDWLARQEQHQQPDLADPADKIQAFEDVGERLAELEKKEGLALHTLVHLPACARELASALGVSDRHGRRIVADMKAVAAAGQGSLFTDLPGLLFDLGRGPLA